MSNHQHPIASEDNDLNRLIAGYREWLAAKGYASSTINTIMKAVPRLTAHMSVRNIAPADCGSAWNIDPVLG